MYFSFFYKTITKNLLLLIFNRIAGMHTFMNIMKWLYNNLFLNVRVCCTMILCMNWMNFNLYQKYLFNNNICTKVRLILTYSLNIFRWQYTDDLTTEAKWLIQLYRDKSVWIVSQLISRKCFKGVYLIYLQHKWLKGIPKIFLVFSLITKVTNFVIYQYLLDILSYSFTSLKWVK